VIVVPKALIRALAYGLARITSANARKPESTTNRNEANGPVASGDEGTAGTKAALHPGRCGGCWTFGASGGRPVLPQVKIAKMNKQVARFRVNGRLWLKKRERRTIYNPGASLA
jgi:hypothetical protein